MEQLKHSLKLYRQWDKMNETGQEIWLRTFSTRIKDCIAAGRGAEAGSLIRESLPESVYQAWEDLLCE